MNGVDLAIFIYECSARVKTWTQVGNSNNSGWSKKELIGCLLAHSVSFISSAAVKFIDVTIKYITRTIIKNT